MRLPSFFASCLAASLFAGIASAQSCPLTVVSPPKLTLPRNQTAELALEAKLPPGCHANSNTPSEAYLIPLTLTWAPGAVEAAEVVYPKPVMEKYDFADKPLSVFSGDIRIVTRFRRAASAQPGPAALNGKLRYQACNDKMCFPPRTVDVKLPLLLQ